MKQIGSVYLLIFYKWRMWLLYTLIGKNSCLEAVCDLYLVSYCSLSESMRSFKIKDWRFYPTFCFAGIRKSVSSHEQTIELSIQVCAVRRSQAMIVIERLMPIIMGVSRARSAITISRMVPFVIIVQTFITAHKHPLVNSPTSRTLWSQSDRPLQALLALVDGSFVYSEAATIESATQHR